MRTHRLALLFVAVALTAAACNDLPGPTESAPPPDRDGMAFNRLDLSAMLADWIRRAPADARRNSDAPSDATDVDAHGTLALIGTPMFNFDAVADPNQGAFAATLPLPVGPCDSVDFGAYRWMKRLSAANVADMDAELLAGGQVLVEFRTNHTHTGADEGPGAYREQLRLRHWSITTGIVTQLAVDGRAEVPIPDTDPQPHVVDWAFPITSVAGWADGDSLWVGQFGVAAARDDDCDSGTTSITQWASGGAPQVTR